MRRFNLISRIVLVAVLAVVGVASILLALTVRAAQRINKKAEQIAMTGRGINSDTDSIVQLGRTNRTATSILKSADPLSGQLRRIVRLARSIDGLARSIDGTAGGINATAASIGSSAGRINGSASDVNGSATTILSSAGSIDGSVGGILSSAGKINLTAKGIDAPASGIATIARLIDRDARLINLRLDSTIGIAGSIKGDTGNILGEARSANSHASCIDRKLYGQQGDNGDCR